MSSILDAAGSWISTEYCELCTGGMAANILCKSVSPSVRRVWNQGWTGCHVRRRDWLFPGRTAGRLVIIVFVTPTMGLMHDFVVFPSLDMSMLGWSYRHMFKVRDRQMFVYACAVWCIPMLFGVSVCCGDKRDRGS